MPPYLYRAATTALALGLLICSEYPAFSQQGVGVSVPPGKSVRGIASQDAAGTHSPWVMSHQSSVRLIAGALASSTGQSRLLAGLEMRLSEGWKTYWRHPGDDGGLPPAFDWSAARNLKAARVLYPAPQRLKSSTGMSIGYMSNVVFPIEIEAVDATRPIELVLNLEYGICREICVPAEARMRLTIAPTLAVMPNGLSAALARVPRVLTPSAETDAPGSPRLAGAAAVLTGPSAALTFDIATGAAGARADLFVEAPAGMHLPMTVKTGEARAGVQRFRIGLNGVEDAARLPGKPLRLTITGISGGTEQSWIVR